MSDLHSEGAIAAENTILEEDGTENRQLFKNSPLRHEYPTGQSLRDPLRGTKPPNFAIVREKAEHRILLLLKLKGLSNREISEQTGYTESWISQVTRQPWFQDMLVEKIAEAGDREVDELIAIEAKNCVFTLINLRDDTNQNGSVRATCARDLLDRFLGKPVQRNENLNVDLTAQRGAVAQLDQVDAELKALQQKLNELVNQQNS